jgi:1,4-dihydroxy-6-naphthoate synthase
MTLSLAYSPCPNDTFVFHALAHGLVPGAPDVEVLHADVDVTNTLAEEGGLDIVKVSYGALPWLLDQYALLPCGGAVGHGCGPLVVTRNASSGASLEGLTIAVPGERTTAYLLMRLWAADDPPASIEIAPFDEIMPGVEEGRFDAGLVIHEARFTYQRHGLHAVVDLGAWWEEETDLPIPLGAILAHRERVDADAATAWVRASLEHAQAYPFESRSYVLDHAQELEIDVVEQHIALYVNEFTHELGDEGYAAVEALLEGAARAGLVPALSGPLG